jgi:hypothetical protein
MLKVVDRFTTRDGSWEPNNLPFSITQVAAEKYKGIQGAGAAHHIFVLPKVDSAVVEFNTLDGKNKTEHFTDKNTIWVHHPIFEPYNPDKGEEGAWHVWVDGERVTQEGIGLPYGWHVSTFLVVEDVAPQVEPVEPGAADKYQLYRNGTLVWES